MYRMIFAVVASIVFAPLARADVMILPPGLERFVHADVVIVGKVVGIEPMDVETTMTPGSEYKFRFRVAIVKVSETLVGDKNVDRNKAPATASEDFAFMLDAKAGCYAWIGNGTQVPLHNPAFDFNDALIPYGALYWASLATAWSKKADSGFFAQRS